MKKANGLFIGLLFIVVGFLYACSALDFIDFSIFFPGWWTLFIIVPCLYALTRKNEDKTGPVIGLIIGICFLINAQDIDFHIDFFPMALAVLCILIGWKLIFPGKKKEQKHVEVNFNSETGEKEVVINDVKFDNTYTKNSNGYVNASAILGGKDIRVDNECFTGADICVVMGAIDLNLRNAIISEDVYINVSAVMGGIDIYVPANVRVVTDGCSTIMGGIDVNTSYANFQTADTPRVIITGSCVMGGIDIQ
ncbi:MAG: hypothetical protein IJ353_08875 [Lachnospiraceae bacterium]|nr:hypothetical protein [Lachnospiraceae bacterium]